jgi:SAM-dependent methyltransferase
MSKKISDPNLLLNDSKIIRKQIFIYTLLKIIPKFFICPKLIMNRSFLQILHNPLNYVRQLEIPITLLYLKPKKTENILDVSSPKILSLYLAANNINNVLSTDIDDYFIKDFIQFSKLFNIKLKTKIFDARKIPFSENTFDKIFSISVLEHIPNDEDQKAVLEMTRVLKPKGKLIVTVPMSLDYLEKYLSSANFYWKTHTKQSKGLFFFQRRYDFNTLLKKIKNPKLKIENIIYICEKPINKPKFNKNGKYLYNNYWADNIKLLGFFPLLRYLIDRNCSDRYHYLSNDLNNHTTHAVINFSKKI